MKGMMVHVLRDAGGMDCTAGGLSGRATQALLIDGLNDSLGVFEAREGDEVFVVRHRNGLPPVAVPGK